MATNKTQQHSPQVNFKLKKAPNWGLRRGKLAAKGSLGDEDIPYTHQGAEAVLFISANTRSLLSPDCANVRYLLIRIINIHPRLGL